MHKSMRIAAGLAVLSMIVAACGDDDGDSGSSSSGSSESGGSGGDALTISVDLPFQGASADASNATVQAIELYLDQVDHKAGDYTVNLTQYDDSTAAKGAWDDATCSANAQKHVSTAGEVAVMGTYNSGCAKLEVPILNQAPDGAMLMVSHANTNPGLTKAWDPGEPDSYYPTGSRNYARVVTTDDYQGAAAAQFVAQDLKLKKCFIVNDNQTYGIGVAQAFETEAAKQGIEILGNEAWDAKQPNYTALFNQIKALGPDCLYIGGIYDNNGGQLVKDKFNILGDNDAVKMIGPDGFTGYPDLDAQPESQGMYLTFAGLASEQLLQIDGPGKDLLEAYKAEYGDYPSTNYALYGVQAVQVILAAIAKSDGTKAGVTKSVFEGDGITIPADQAVLGKEIKIDTATGDVNALDISVLQMTDNVEKFLKAWPVTSG